ncbi:uncharacterized protein [Miscanthus floridulus]|uniref:uncharacterized protein n=1 Tax=Miscanthus floridulus TaxID=154761 RepID=UPI00345A698C
MQRGVASDEAVSEEVAAQGKGAEAAVERVEEGEPTPHDVVGLGATGAGASSTAEAIESEAGAPKTSEVRAVDSGAIEVEMAEARAPGSIETEAMEVEAEQTLAPPQADPEGEPVFALEDIAEGGRWDTLEEYRQLAVRSLQTAMTVMGGDLPGVTRAELVTAKGQAAPLVAKIKELEEERDSFRSRAQEAMASAKATAGQLGAEQSEHQATKVALAEATKVAEASRVEVLAWKNKAEGKFHWTVFLIHLFRFAFDSCPFVAT